MRVLAYTVTRLITPQRQEMWERTFNQGKDKAGVDFDWAVWDNTKVNRGQHLPFNHFLEQAHREGYDELLRIDEDVEFMSQRWLAKMLEARVKLGTNFIISPTVKGLLHPPETSQVVNVKGVQVRFLPTAIGGACRLHNVKCLVDGGYVSDVRWPMGAGDGTGIVKWAKEQSTQGNPIWCVWLDQVRVHHGTAKQVEVDPGYHDLHDMLQKVPFVPSWPVDYPQDATVKVKGGNYTTLPDGYVKVQRDYNWRHRDGQFEHHDEAKWVEGALELMLAQSYGSLGSVLDVGCRGGASMVVLQALHPGVRVVGVDIVPEFVAEAVNKGLAVEVADMHALPFKDGEFEWIVCNGTFEHSWNVEKAAREFGRVASKGVYVTCDLRKVPLGSDYAHSQDPLAWRTALAHTGMEVRHERLQHPGVEFVLVRRCE